MNIKPVESGISSVEQLQSAGIIHHDPQKFALAVRTLLFAHSKTPVKAATHVQTSAAPLQGPVLRGKQLLCDYWSSMNAALETRVFEPESLRDYPHESCLEKS